MKEGICCGGAASALCHSVLEIKLFFGSTETGNQAKTKHPEFKFLHFQLGVEGKQKLVRADQISLFNNRVAKTQRLNCLDAPRYSLIMLEPNFHGQKKLKF